MSSITLARVTAINYILLCELENGECELENGECELENAPFSGQL